MYLRKNIYSNENISIVVDAIICVAIAKTTENLTCTTISCGFSPNKQKKLVWKT